MKIARSDPIDGSTDESIIYQDEKPESGDDEHR